MINRFLTAKHWQLFIFTFGIPMILEIGFVFAMVLSVITHRGSDVFPFFSYMKFFPFIGILFMGTLLGWFWSVGVGLQPLIPEDLRLNVSGFKFFVLFPLIYFVLFAGQMSLFMSETRVNPLIFLAIFPLHLFAMFCMFYNFYFVARTFKTIELQRKVELGDYIGEFFLLWFYPVGIWFIQPKINKMAENLIIQDL